MDIRFRFWVMHKHTGDKAKEYMDGGYAFGFDHSSSFSQDKEGQERVRLTYGFWRVEKFSSVRDLANPERHKT
jgi:hypothetical protein